MSDVVQALILAMRRREADGQVFNVGTGQAITVMEVASVLASSLGKRIAPKILGSFREGDVRHNLADISKISRMLGYKARVGFREGMEQLASWIKDQRPHDSLLEANSLLQQKGLIH